MTRPLKVAIIQLTRIGDLIQTLQAARQLKAELESIKLTLIAREQFAKPLKFLLKTVFDEIILVNTKSFFSQGSLQSAQQNMNHFIQKINEVPYDYCVNLSFCKSSSYLNSLVKSSNKFGVKRNSFAEVVIPDRWSQYVYSNVLNTNNVPFSLVDIYKNILGVKDTHILMSDEENMKNNSIVIHPFASQRKKRWGLHKWAEVIYKISREFPEHDINLVGGKEDTSEVKKLINSPALKEIQGKIVNHTPNSSIENTYSLLQKAQLFIGHDSMVAHLASETLTPGIIISLGTVKPHETTPYGKNMINLVPRNSCFPCKQETKCDLLSCHQSINHHVITHLSKGLIENHPITQEYIQQKLGPIHLSNLDVYSTDFDSQGLILKNITNNYNNLQDIFRQFYKVIWPYYFEEYETNLPLPHISPEQKNELGKYTEGLNYLYELYNFGVKYSSNIIEEVNSHPDFKNIQDQLNKIADIDRLCHITKKNYPHLQGLVDYFYVNKANASGDNITDICKHNLLNYYDASNLVSVLSDFIQKTLGPQVSGRKNVETC